MNNKNNEKHFPEYQVKIFKSNVNREDFNQLSKSNPDLIKVDTLIEQTDELIKCLNPSVVFKPDELRKQSLKYIEKQNMDEFAVWIYYPWLNKIVHCLNEDDFIRVRTNRNQYKITNEEYLTLIRKKIGIVGLSVGQSIILTIAQERICGEIRIADFDTLELSNLNRIRSGIFNLGIKKAYLVAREIAEIDPYLKVIVYDEGIHEKNIDSFFISEGKLDLCIEVCDGLQTKIDVRNKAKQYRVPVLMNSSDRGTTDVERYDLVPDYPIMHGLIDHLDATALKGAMTNEEKVPFLFPMLGIETTSAKLKASMLEIQESINTWPQLASGVVLGGAICTDICRRILLNELSASGRTILDLEEVFSDKTFTHKSVKNIFASSEKHISASQIIDILNSNSNFISNMKSKINAYPNTKIISEIIEYGKLAPSGGNSQPWKFCIDQNIIYIINDCFRDNAILNHQSSAGLVSIGACISNMHQYCVACDVKYEFHLNHTNISSQLVGAFIILEENSSHSKDKNKLELMLKRKTNRSKINNLGLSDLPDNIKRISASGECNFKLKNIYDANKINNFCNAIGEIDKLFYTNTSFIKEFLNELRWPEDPRVNSGIEISSLFLKASENAGLEVSKDYKVISLINKWKKGNVFKKLNKSSILNASGIAMITSNILNPIGFINAGIFLQEIWLELTENNFEVQPISISTFINYKFNHDANFSSEFDKATFNTFFNEILKQFELDKNELPVFIFRYFKSEVNVTNSKRLQTEEITFYVNELG